ncbi:transcriptional coactivator/pterin dehydratase [Thamnocephalis sphaerospora]|uniref:4a-hydroxytetrahydrobiopterin dehydratase n=1 Tax=Thamnocephalis sphaerospora TaxID=78915 RepID=A0A4P9XSM9_9FUNG|nr:transcriptional coactivator/pterin dehydratase [Thamnocephalis sphaerospora]|eukprot:RKP09155.1 transcriptional coactivator/pterin dehydratase [Thamnocephalis sphaerospora]
MVQKLTQEERDRHLPALLQAGWQLVDGRDAVKRTFVFKDFNEAFGFMARIALRADKVDHHPEWFNVYNRVEITWSTHDCQGLSQRDLDMIQFCNQVAAPYTP